MYGDQTVVGGQSMRRFSESFGAAVRQALENRGLSQRAASYLTEVDHTTISMMARNKVPSEVIIQRFALGLEPDNPEAGKELLHKLRAAAGFEVPSDPIEGFRVVMQRADRKLTKEEAAELRELIDELENEK